MLPIAVFKCPDGRVSGKSVGKRMAGGTRVPISMILDQIAAGVDRPAILSPRGADHTTAPGPTVVWVTERQTSSPAC
jgi:hypothetical protein